MHIFLLVVLLIATTSVSVDGFSASGTTFALTQPTTICSTSALAASTVVDELVVTTSASSPVLVEDETAVVVEETVTVTAAVAVAAKTTNTNTKAKTTKTNTKSSWAVDDGFVFGLDGSGLERPKGKVAQVVVEGDSLPSTNTHRAVVWTTLVGHASVAAFSLMGMMHGNTLILNDAANVDAVTIGALTALQAVLVTIVSWLMADFGSGVVHWSVDNYGNGRTPILGGIIAAFQGHHSAPWTICEREFENNVSKVCVPFGVQTVLAMKFVFGLGPAATYFWSVFCLMEVLAQEFHKMSHMTKSEAGPIWNALQDRKLTIDRKSHAQHHVAPFDGNYCLVSGRCNKFLDDSGVFRRMEHMVYKVNGIESNAWKLDATLRERTLQGEYVLANSVRSARKQ